MKRKSLTKLPHFQRFTARAVPHISSPMSLGKIRSLITSPSLSFSLSRARDNTACLSKMQKSSDLASTIRVSLMSEYQMSMAKIVHCASLPLGIPFSGCCRSPCRFNISIIVSFRGFKNVPPKFQFIRFCPIVQLDRAIQMCQGR